MNDFDRYNGKVTLSDGSHIELRYLTHEDTVFLAELIDQDIEAKDFSTSMIRHQMVRSDPPTIDPAQWSEEDLKRAAHEFASIEWSGFNTTLPDDAEIFEAFRSAARAYLDELLAEIRESLRALSRLSVESMGIAGLAANLRDSLVLPTITRNSLLPDLQLAAHALSKGIAQQQTEAIQILAAEGARAVRAMTEGLANLRSTLPTLDISSFIPQLPDLREQFDRLRRSRDGAAALETAEFGYSQSLWTIEFLIEISEVDVQVEPDGVVARIQEATESQEFEDALEDVFMSSRALAARWPAVKAGLEDHRGQRYFSSIAVLLPQIEGIVNDILLMLELIVIDGSKVRKKTRDGSLGHELSGLRAKGDLAKQHPLLERALRKYITDKIAPIRNDILHGVTPDYANVNRSVHYALTLASLAKTAMLIEEDLNSGTAEA